MADVLPYEPRLRAPRRVRRWLALSLILIAAVAITIGVYLLDRWREQYEQRTAALAELSAFRSYESGVQQAVAMAQKDPNAGMKALELIVTRARKDGVLPRVPNPVPTEGEEVLLAMYVSRGFSTDESIRFADYFENCFLSWGNREDKERWFNAKYSLTSAGLTAQFPLPSHYPDSPRWQASTRPALAHDGR